MRKRPLGAVLDVQGRPGVYGRRPIHATGVLQLGVGRHREVRSGSGPRWEFLGLEGGHDGRMLHGWLQARDLQIGEDKIAFQNRLVMTYKLVSRCEEAPA